MTDELQGYPIADSTRKIYEGHLERLDGWRKGREITDELLADYVGILFEKGKSPKYAGVILSAARWRCLSEDKPDPRGRRCRAAIANFRRKGIGRGTGQVSGLTWEKAELLAALAAQEKTPYGIRDAAIILVMSDALLRVSEAAAINVCDVDFNESTLFIPRSKTDQTGKGATLYLGPQTLEAVRTWIEKAELTDGPLFRPIHKTFLHALPGQMHPHTIRYNIQTRAKQAGIKDRVSGHSLRVGSAQSLASRQATLVEMQQCGRWSSPEMPGLYARKFTAQQSAVARLRYAGQ